MTPKEFGLGFVSPSCLKKTIACYVKKSLIKAKGERVDVFCMRFIVDLWFALSALTKVELPVESKRAFVFRESTRSPVGSISPVRSL